MASLADIDIKFVIKNRPGGILLHSQVRTGENEIQLRHILRVVLELHEMVACLGRERCKNLLDLFFLLYSQFSQLVVESDDGSGLDKKCGACGGLVVNESRNLGFIFCLDGDTVAVAAQGDHVVLQIGGVGRVDHLCQLLMNFVPGHLHFPAHFAKGRGGVVCDLFLGENAAPDLRRQGRDRIQAVEEVKEDIGPVFCLVCARTAYGRLTALFGRGAFAGFLPA